MTATQLSALNELIRAARDAAADLGLPAPKAAKLSIAVGKVSATFGLIGYNGPDTERIERVEMVAIR